MILVSACLVGVNCNYKGKSCLNESVAAMVREGRAIPVCPELLGGLTTPRPPAEIKNERVITKDGDDITDAFLAGANKTLEICQKYNCQKAVLKANSPSCGCGKIYDGNFNGTLVDGKGITARLLIEHGIEVI